MASARFRIIESSPRPLALAVAASLGAGILLSGCYAPQINLLRSGLDSLRVVVDTMTVRDSVTLAVLQATRRDLAEQKDILLSTRASSGTTTQELFEQMTRLDARLEEALARFDRQQRSSASTIPAGGEMGQSYDQASLDLTQGRYRLALQEFRDYVKRYPTSDLADNAQYGVGECYFAQAVFDSAETEYAKVEASFPKGDKVPAALYKLALSKERLKKTSEAKKTLEDLVKRYPNSGEAQLARERLGTAQKR